MLGNNFIIIPSIRSMKDFEHALSAESKYVFLSEIHIGNLKVMVEKCHSSNKLVVVNIELIGGFSADQVGLKLLKSFYNVDAVLSSNAMKINIAKSLGLKTVQRFFLMDSRSFDSTLKSLQTTKNDAVEILPGPIAPQFIDAIKKVRNVPMIAGGFVSTKDMVKELYKAGFSGVTSSTRDLWKLKLTTK